MALPMKLIKTCKNPECESEIKTYKSSKRLYCDDTCKNRAAYLIKTVEEAPLLEMDKAMRRNYKVLNRLKDLALGPIELQTLRSHGFNFDAIHKAEIKIDDKGMKVQLPHVYGIYFEIVNNSQLIIK